jgi:amidophosphoribosyltransferase
LWSILESGLPGEDVAKLTYFGLYALQHRGQEAAGIAVSNGNNILVFKDMGLVAQVFDEATLDSLKGHLAIGHTRYSTTGASNWENSQPTFRATKTGHLALAHNGNLVNTKEIANKVINQTTKSNSQAESKIKPATSDSDAVTALLASYPDLSIEEAAMREFPNIKGAFSFIFMDEQTLYAARDPQGIRPLVLGKLEKGWIIASETAALDIVGAAFVREIEPGEIISIDEHGLRSKLLQNQKQNIVYLNMFI